MNIAIGYIMIEHILFRMFLQKYNKIMWTNWEYYQITREAILYITIMSPDF
jgi:hypothetical protein